MQRRPYQERRSNYLKLKVKYPDKIPVIIETTESLNLPSNQYLVEKSTNMCTFHGFIRNRLDIEPHQAIFLTVNGNLIPSSMSLSEIHSKYKNEDEFLYFRLSLENTFG